MGDHRKFDDSISMCDFIFDNLEDMMSEEGANKYRFHYMRFKRHYYDLKRNIKNQSKEIKKLKNKIEELENQNARYIERLEFEIKVRAAYHRKGNELNEKIEKLKKDIEDYDDLKLQILTKNTFLMEKHLTSKYAKWLVEYNKQKRAT
jgi:chromosome segregation ATPase